MLYFVVEKDTRRQKAEKRQPSVEGRPSARRFAASRAALSAIESEGSAAVQSTKKKQALFTVLAVTAVAAAYACRLLAMFDIGGKYPSYVRAAIYILLFSLWGVSIDRRIIQKQVLHCLRMTAALMIFWLILRTLKYEVVTDPTVARYIWYLYYLPMLFIPLIGVYIAQLLGEAEDYRLTAKDGALSVIPAVLFGFVITNDLHQQVFAFKSRVPGVPVSSNFSHCSLYFVCVGWMVICMFYTLIRLFKKSRIPGSSKKRYLPFVFGCAAVVYGVLYMSGLPAIRRWFGDMNVMFCLLYASIYESCIRCRLIQSNMGYRELFRISGIGGYITDKAGNCTLRSDSAGETDLCPEPGSPVIQPDGMRISSAPINGGYIVWQADISRLLALREKLQNAQKELEENKRAQQKAYKIQKELHETKEKNRIYDRLELKLKKQRDIVTELLDRCKTADEAETRRLLRKATVIGSYVKRSANLNFLGAEYKIFPQQEVRLSFDETVRALNFYGAQAAAVYRMTKPMAAETALFFYDFLENVIEETLDGLQSLVITIFDDTARMFVECAADLSHLSSECCTVVLEDGLWLITVSAGGDENA